MVGRVRVRGQGPVRRRQTTTTFKKGGRVKLMHGGPSARTRHIENEKEEIRRVDRNIRRNEGYKTGGRVKKVKGGMMKLARTLHEDVKDSRKKLNVHQDPRSGLSSALRHMRDNPPKKKSKSPHTEKKKRTLRDDYLKHLRKLPTKPRAKGIPDAARRSLAPTGSRPRMKKATGGEAKRPTPRMMGQPWTKSPTARKSRVMTPDTDFHKRKRAAAKDKGKPNTPGEKMRTFQGMYSAGQARNKKTFRGDFDVGKQLRKKRKHHS